MVRNPPTEWDRRVDVAVVGSGTGLLAALRAATEGAETLVVEKAPVVGGSTAVSSAGTWIPTAHHVVENLPAEKTDHDVLRRYLERVAGDRVDEALIDRFVETGGEAVDFVEEHSGLEFIFHHYPDYFPDWEGGDPSGHGIKPALFDASGLGDRLDDVRDAPHRPAPFTSEELAEIGCFARLPAEIDQAVIAEREANDVLSHGRAMVAALYEACLDAGVAFETGAPAVELVVEDDAVVGLVAETDGREEAIGVDGGVVLAAGGMEWDEEMRENFLRGPMTAPASPPQNTGDGIRMGMALGTKLGNMNEAWWMPTGHVPGEEWADGSPVYRMLLGERAVPGAIMVNADGRRFCNEAGRYNEIGKTFHEFDPEAYDYRNVPAYLVFDRDYRERYAVMTLLPDDPDPEWLTVADTVDGLAEALGVDRDGLVATVSRFNDAARAGEDPEHGRGAGVHDEFFGDTETDHPNLGPIDTPPYYAMPVHAGSLGTKGGIVTTSDAEAVTVEESTVPGLYAAGNTTAHVMGIGYAGGGGTLGPNLVFNYIAGGAAAGRARGRR